MRRYAIALVAVIALAGCREREDPVPDPKAAAPAAPTVVDEIAQPALDKARAVEQDVLDSAGKTDAALDAAEGG
jgi:hypothetical protein